MCGRAGWRPWMCGRAGGRHRTGRVEPRRLTDRRRLRPIRKRIRRSGSLSPPPPHPPVPRFRCPDPGGVPALRSSGIPRPRTPRAPAVRDDAFARMPSSIYGHRGWGDSPAPSKTSDRKRRGTKAIFLTSTKCEIYIWRTNTGGSLPYSDRLRGPNIEAPCA